MCDELEASEPLQPTSKIKRARKEIDTDWRPSYTTVAKARGRQQKVPKPGVQVQRVAARTIEYAKPAFDFDFVMMRMSELGEFRPSAGRPGNPAVRLHH